MFRSSTLRVLSRFSPSVSSSRPAAAFSLPTFLARCYTDGKPLFCKAAVAHKAGEELKIEMIEVAPPKPKEVRIKMIATAICHTDHFTLSGADPEGIFPSILGHEGAGIVESVGSEVTSLKPGDHVIPVYTPQCGECVFCKSKKTNLCVSIRATQGKGLMPDQTTRFKLRSSGQSVFHYMGCSTFSEYTVLPEIAACKIPKNVPLDKAALFGCGVTTGIGAVTNTCKVEPGSSVAVFGLGAVGLSVIQGARLAGAKQIIAIDTNSEKEGIARKLGATDFVNPKNLPAGKTIVQHLQGMSETGFGIDYTFECIGNVKVMRDALESAARGWGVSCIIGVAGAGQEISTRPFQLVTGRTWKGTAFGGVKSKTELPGLVDQYMQGKIDVDCFITHTMKLEDINKGFHLLEEGKSLRTVILF